MKLSTALLDEATYLELRRTAEQFQLSPEQMLALSVEVGAPRVVAQAEASRSKPAQRPKRRASARPR